MKPIVLLGEAWGENEERIRRPFVGASGIELIRMLSEAKILSLTSDDFDYIRRFYTVGDPHLLDCVWNLHPEVHRTNVFQSRPPGNELKWYCGPRTEGIPGYPALIKGKYVRREFAHELERLTDEIIDLDPNLVVCFGNAALWALSGNVGITKLRGATCTSTLTASGFKLLPTFHPAAVLRQWELRPVVVADLIKAKAESAFPEVRRPHREIWIEPSLGDIHAFIQNHVIGCDILSVDIETAGNQVTCIGFAPSPFLGIVIPFYDGRKRDRSYWPDVSSEREAWRLIRAVLEDPEIKKLFQNGLYDISFLLRSLGIKVLGAEHDTMLLHHALQPESLKNLGFLGSIYGNEGAWKAEHRRGTLKRDN